MHSTRPHRCSMPCSLNCNDRSQWQKNMGGRAWKAGVAHTHTCAEGSTLRSLCSRQHTNTVEKRTKEMQRPRAWTREASRV